MHRSLRTTLAALALTAVAFTASCSAQADPAGTDPSTAAVDASTEASQAAEVSIEQIRETSTANLDAAGFVVMKHETITGQYGEYPPLEMIGENPLYEQALDSETKPSHWTQEEVGQAAVVGMSNLFATYVDSPAMMRSDTKDETEDAELQAEWREERIEQSMGSSLKEAAPQLDPLMMSYTFDNRDGEFLRLVEDGVTPRVQDVSDLKLVSSTTQGGQQLYKVTFTVTYNSQFGDGPIMQPGFARDMEFEYAMSNDAGRYILEGLGANSTITEETAAMLEDQTGEKVQ